MNNRQRRNLRTKLLNDTERFLNHAIESKKDAGEQSSRNQLSDLIDNFFQTIARFGRLRSYQAKMHRRQSSAMSKH